MQPFVWRDCARVENALDHAPSAGFIIHLSRKFLTVNSVINGLTSVGDDREVMLGFLCNIVADGSNKIDRREAICEHGRIALREPFCVEMENDSCIRIGGADDRSILRGVLHMNYITPLLLQITREHAAVAWKQPLRGGDRRRAMKQLGRLFLNAEEEPV